LGPNVRGTLEVYWGLESKSPNIYILAFFNDRVKICGGCLQFENLKGELAPESFTGALISNHQTSKFSLFCSKNENLLVGICNLRF
jgi:hypothetical protein